MQAADALIVLGGEPNDRAQAAVTLFKQDVAPSIFVTGQSRGVDTTNLVASTLRREDVPDSVIVWETAATSTYEDAAFVRPLLRQAGVQRAVVVTSWFHTRRALSTFQHVIPEVSFSVSPVCHKYGWSDHPYVLLRQLALQEYLKMGWYAIRYGIWPTHLSTAQGTAPRSCACSFPE